jgi:hypothetical protein
MRVRSARNKSCENSIGSPLASVVVLVMASVPADDEHPGPRAREHAGDALADAPGRAGHHDGAARD